MEIKRWKLPEIDTRLVAALQKETGLPELVVRILAARGYRDTQQIADFLSSDRELDSPYLLADMEPAVERVRGALEAGERIAVYGDYDCDGITSTALLTSYLQSVGADVIYYVPSREKEGYGLNKGSVDVLHGQKTNLIITVDNGISAHEEIAYAATLGIDVVVTDHHTPRDSLPPAVAVVNPRRTDCQSRFKDLAGVGVAFKLVCALEEAEATELLEYYSDLVALGTVADVVPLVDENRAIVRHGLGHLSESERPGIRALLQECGLAGKVLTGESAAFGLIPRINAAGRMDTADDAIELLLTDDENLAAELAQAIEGCNRERKKIEDEILTQIEGILAANPHMLNKRVLVVSGEGWHHGVVGIVSAKLMERYGKPTILFSTDGELARGSGRSLEGFSLIAAISACSERLLQYGGHVLAAGLTLRVEDLAHFQDSLERYARETCPVMPVPAYAVASVLDPRKMSIPAIQALDRMEPFGAANESPLFLLENLRIEAIYPTSDSKHLRIRFAGQGFGFMAVYFRMSEELFPYTAGDVVDTVASVSVGEWNGAPQLSVKIKDLRRSGLNQETAILSWARYQHHRRGEYDTVPAKEDIAPGREDLALVYRQLKKYGEYRYAPPDLYCRLLDSGVDLCKLCIALDVLEEMGLITRESGAMRTVADAPKVDLKNSEILQALRG